METGPLVAVALGAGVTIFLLTRKAGATTLTGGTPEGLGHPDDLVFSDPSLGEVPVMVMTETGVYGWKGPVVERPRIHQPIFQSGRTGNAAFIRYVVGALMQIEFTQEQALLFATHKARESGWGKFIWNNNFGNIKTGSPVRGPWFWMTDARKFRDKYRAYDTPEDGIADNVNLVKKSRRYQKSWALLMAGNPNWYGQLGLDGYYEGPPDKNRPGKHTNHTPATVAPVQREYNAMLATARKYLATV